MNNLWQTIAGFPSFLLYFALALALLGIFVAIYVRVTPYREIALIREGNIAASISLSGAIMGVVFPLASAIAHSVSALDMVAWGVIALVVQLVVYALTGRLCLDSGKRSKPAVWRLRCCWRQSPFPQAS